MKEALDAAFVSAKDVINLLDENVFMIMITDPGQIYDEMNNGRRTTERRLMTDFATADKLRKLLDMKSVWWIVGGLIAKEGKIRIYKRHFGRNKNHKKWSSYRFANK